MLGFSLWGFPRINLCVFLYGCACLSFSDPLDYGYAAMMLNVLRFDITIKNSIWYQSYPKRINCAATEARVSYFLGLSPQSISKSMIG